MIYRARIRATMEDLGRAYRAFLGDGDERARARAELLEGLYAPFRRQAATGKVDALPFLSFVEANRTRIDLVDEPLPNYHAEPRDA